MRRRPLDQRLGELVADRQQTMLDQHRPVSEWYVSELQLSATRSVSSIADLLTRRVFAWMRP